MPVTVKNADLDRLIASLSALDGRPELVKMVGTDGTDRNMVNVIPYKLSAKVRLLAAKWITALKGQADIAKKAQDAIFKAHQKAGEPGKPDQIPPENMKAYGDDLDALRDESTAHDIALLPLAHLNVEANNLPVTVLSNLAALIDDAEPEPKKA